MSISRTDLESSDTEWESILNSLLRPIFVEEDEEWLISLSGVINED